uniref:Ig-like domain-containing protein n=1 Tax=Equus caballus TaxID=9796 RepID=F7DYE0_HORSE
EIMLTQSPASTAVSQGERVTVTCRISTSISTGARPNLPVHRTSSLASGIPSHFSGSRSGMSYSLTISSVKAEDAAIYYCQHTNSDPPTCPASSLGTKLEYQCPP